MGVSLNLRPQRMGMEAQTPGLLRRGPFWHRGVSLQARAWFGCCCGESSVKRGGWLPAQDFVAIDGMFVIHVLKSNPRYESEGD